MRVLTYCLAHTATSAAVLFQLGSENVWRLNSLFDPDLTGGTHQPYGFDQMAALYGRYRVQAVTVDVRGTPTVGFEGALALAAQPSTETNVLTGQALGNVDEMTCSHVEFLSSAGNPFHIRKRFTIADLEGLTTSQLSNNVEDYGAVITTSPTRTPFVRIAYANTSSASAEAVGMIVRLEYEAEFYDRTTLGASS